MKDEALKLALEALEYIDREDNDRDFLFPFQCAMLDKAITAIKQTLAAPVQEPVLQDIEQYRLQMAGISTAAIGYWKESDSVHPDYDTLALRDVAKLYAKYDELYKAQNVTHGVIAGALFDFMGWLTSRPKRIMLSSADDASPAVDAIRDFAKMRGLSLDDAQVQSWQEALTDSALDRMAENARELGLDYEPVQEPVGPEPFGYFQYDIRLDAWVQNRINNKGVAFYTKKKP
jgi:hypothetical protein